MESELQQICNGVVALIGQNLIPSASASESKELPSKKKGDYHRQLAESATGDAWSEAGKDARVACAAEATK